MLMEGGFEQAVFRWTEQSLWFEHDIHAVRNHQHLRVDPSHDCDDCVSDDGNGNVRGGFGRHWARGIWSTRG